MRPCLSCSVLAIAACLSTPARADFAAALRDYNAGRYEQAQAQFRALADLGDCPSQFNLGAMALKGQGGAADRGAAAGWLQAAQSNGCQQLVGNKLAPLQTGLTAAEAHTAADIVARYGRETLKKQGIVSPELQCSGETAALPVSTPAADPHYLGVGVHPDAIVIAVFTIGIDGRARDPEVLLAEPPEGFAAAAIEAWLNSRFTPATRSGVPVESRVQAKLRFAGASGNLADAPAFKSALPASQAGEPAAQYLVGLAAMVDPTLGVTPARGGELLLSAARAGEPAAQYWIGMQERATAACHHEADGTPWLRHAAAGGSAPAQVLLAQDLVSGTPSAAQLAEARALLGRAAGADSYYARKHAVALLAASPVEDLRDPATALQAATPLLSGQIQADPQLFEVIAAASAASGNYEAAAAQQRTAIRKARALGWNLQLMTQRQDAYHQHRPWRGDLFALPPS